MLLLEQRRHDAQCEGRDDDGADDDDDTGRGDTPYDRGAEDALAAAADGSITVVSIKHDWSQVFPAPS